MHGYPESLLLVGPGQSSRLTRSKSNTGNAEKMKENAPYEDALPHARDKPPSIGPERLWSSWAMRMSLHQGKWCLRKNDGYLPLDLRHAVSVIGTSGVPLPNQNNVQP